MTTLNAEEIKSLERTRQQLFQLSNSLGQLRFELESRGDPLPPWPSIQTSTALISYNLRAILDQIDSKKQFLRSAHVYPSAAFPGRTQENLLAQLLRKRIGPSDEDWIKEGHEAVAAIASSYDKSTETTDNHVNNNIFDQLWEWAGPAANNVAKEVLLSIDESDDDDSDEGEDNNDIEESTRMEGIESQNNTQFKEGTAASNSTLEETFKFMCTGSI